MLSRLHLARSLGRLVVPAILYICTAFFCMLRIVHVSPGHRVSGTGSEQTLFPRLGFLPNKEKFFVVTNRKEKQKKIKQRRKRRNEALSYFHKET